LLWVTPLLAQQNPSATLTTQTTDDKMNIHLSWNTSVQASYYQYKRQLHIQFSRPLGQIDIANLLEWGSKWLLNVQHGYDSLLLVLGRDVGANIISTETSVTVHLIRIFPQQKTNTPSQQPAHDDRLNYLRAVTLLHTGELHKARRILIQLSDKKPSDINYLKNLAVSEYRLGNWRAAYQHYNHVVSLDPEQKDAQQARYQLIRKHGGQIQLDSTRRIANNNDEQSLIRLHANTLFSMDWRLTGTLSRREIHLDETSHRTLSALTTIREDVELSLSHQQQGHSDDSGYHAFTEAILAGNE